MSAPRPANYTVMQRRFEPGDDVGLYPTPPWAARAILEIIDARFGPLQRMSALEPAAGLGHMLGPLSERFQKLEAADAYDHGCGFPVRDYLVDEQPRVDWMITNPPFPLAERFAQRAFTHVNEGVALLARTSFLEGKRRYERLFAPYPPALVAQFTERVPMLKGRVDRKATTATSYAWIVWSRSRFESRTEMVWIPPCRARLERDDDYV